jgi:hypothetical protein
MPDTTAAVRRSLFLHAPIRRTPRLMLEQMLALVDDDTPADGPDGPVAVLERRLADLLGKESALFFPSGTMAQQVALRLHADRRGRRTFAAHPQSHLEVWEEQGYNAVHGLRLRRTGDPHELMTADDLAASRSPRRSGSCRSGTLVGCFRSGPTCVSRWRSYGRAGPPRTWTAPGSGRPRPTTGGPSARSDPPQTPLFHIHLPASRRAVEQAGEQILSERGIQLWGRVRSAPDPGRCSFEISVGDNAMEFTPGEVVTLIRDVLASASSHPGSRPLDQDSPQRSS